MKQFSVLLPKYESAYNWVLYIQLTVHGKWWKKIGKIWFGCARSPSNLNFDYFQNAWIKICTQGGLKTF